MKTVEQAHGSPANWLDLYGASDIPQTESFGASPFKGGETMRVKVRSV